MDARLQEALKRAKGLLGEEPVSNDPNESVLEDFDKVVAEARAYLVANESTISEDIDIEIRFSKDEFEISFESGND